MTNMMQGWILLIGCCVCVAGLAVPRSSATQTIADAEVLPVPALAQPGYLETVRDPTFNTQLTRVSDPGVTIAPGMSCRLEYCTHRYSSAQAWNADQSLLAIAMGCSGICFLDGRSYAPLFQRNISGHCEWHPTEPTNMICVMNKGITKWNPRTDELQVIWTTSRYADMKFGPGKGNPSFDGSTIAVRARNGHGQVVGFAYDIDRRIKYPDIDLSALHGDNSYVSISPSGRYIFAFQKPVGGIQQAFVFSRDGKLVQHWPEHHRPGHGDMTIDRDGEDVYVGVSKSDPDKYHIIKRRLSDGKVTVLAPYGDGNHVSARSINRPGWVFVTYSGSYQKVSDHPEWAPFQGEVVAMRIDGSGQVRRFAHTRTAKAGYFSHALGSVSPDASQVIWSSNWGNASGPVAAYVTRLDWPDAPAAKPASD